MHKMKLVKAEFILDAHLFLVAQGNSLHIIIIIKKGMIITMTMTNYDNNKLQFMIMIIIIKMFEISV